MCKLSLNIVPNIYNSLKSSFLSLAWPWPGRSLPNGNQLEYWDPQLGPMWSGSQSTCHCNAPLTPVHTPNSPLTPLGAPMPLMPPIPLLAPEYLHFLPAPQYTPDNSHNPLMPQCPQQPPTPLHP